MPALLRPQTLNPCPTQDECCSTAEAVRVNYCNGFAFQRLGRPGPSGGSTVKRIATTLLVAGLFAAPMLALPPRATAAVGVSISVGIAPPPLPVYEQPVVPGPGFIWIPGYWAWDPAYGYFWVPGTWVMPPEVGLLWTPGWWGWSDGYYRWHPGYWSHQVGFYGGINYGHGYFGAGYVGGEWRGREFYYNRAVNNINVTNIRNVYVNRTVVRNVHGNRVSYNGGRGGITARPTAAQRAVANAHRVAPTRMQEHQRELAARDPAQRFKTNKGRPAVFATQHAGRFEGAHAVRASSAPRKQATGQANPERARAVPQPRTTNRPDHERATVKAPQKRAHDASQPRPANAPHPNPSAVQAPPGRARPVQPMRPQPPPRKSPNHGNAQPPPARPSHARPASRETPRSARSTQGQPHAQQSGQRGKPNRDKHKSNDGQHR